MRAASAQTAPPAVVVDPGDYTRPITVTPAVPPGPYVPDPSYYDYDSKSPFVADEKPFSEKNGIKITRVTFPSPVTTPYATNDTVVAYLFMPPEPGPHPALIVLPEWLPRNLKNEFQFCEDVTKAHTAALLIESPFSLDRRPLPHVPQAELLSGNMPQMVGAIRQNVLDVRRGLDWLSTRPDIDSSRMGLSGISLGAIIASLAAGVDRRAKVLLSIDGGADAAGLLWKSPFMKGLHKQLVQHGYNYEDLKVGMAPVEPTNWLKGYGAENALLVNGRYDTFILPKQSQMLADSIGGAPIVWANTGHYGLVLAEKNASNVGAEFLRARFFASGKPFNPPQTIAAPTIKLGLMLGGQGGLSPALATQLINFDQKGRYSLDGMLTFHGLSLGLSGRLGQSSALGVEFPLLHGDIKPRPYLLMHIVL
ncbi:hypothetical protein CCAX7_13250 [Capsulimonas corticalis]|uniref:Uncharacterized protein n=1 Tax=Capsulimonas corticalis TaxID=2219043 RepID=A0A402D4R2_9BACT|nr:hypothetical protein CCAX7_13250 [Capsulimonas corticalis]